MKTHAVFALALLLGARAAVSQTPAEPAPDQQAEWSAIRAKPLPEDPASELCEIIEGSHSPDGRYAFGFYSEEETCLVDLKLNRVIAWSPVAHRGPNQKYNYNSLEVIWSKDSSQVLELEQGKWDTHQAEAFRISDGKATWLGDVMTSLRQAGDAREKKNPAFKGAMTIGAAEFGKKLSLSGSGVLQVPQSLTDDSHDFTFSGSFSSGKFKVESLKAK